MGDEHILLTSDEHEILWLCKNQLQVDYQVSIDVPKFEKISNEIIFAIIQGSEESKSNVMDFLKQESMKKKVQRIFTPKDDASVIVLSDSDEENKEDSILIIEPSVEKPQVESCKKSLAESRRKALAAKRSKRFLKNRLQKIQQRKLLSKDCVLATETVITSQSTLTSCSQVQKKRRLNNHSTKLPDFIPINACGEWKRTLPKTFSLPNLKVNVNSVSNSRCVSNCSISSVSSVELMPEPDTNKDESIIILSDEEPSTSHQETSAQHYVTSIPPFTTSIPPSMTSLPPSTTSVLPSRTCIPIPQVQYFQFRARDCQIPQPVPPVTRRLRPIVIDGSNVARSHGKSTGTYSCKGIKLSVDFFLSRGHFPVTAFLPHFRRHNKYGAVPNTDENLLEDLEKMQNVVFTPSRKLQGRTVASYDDRFIVELASKNGGVILSNDNYRDLMEESTIFKETIENRLLMFCFVGDILMIPSDPLGRTGPKLDEFLSFPDPL